MFFFHHCTIAREWDTTSCGGGEEAVSVNSPMRLLTSFSGDQIKGCSYIFRMKEMVTRGLSGITFSEPSLWWPSPVKPPPKSISQPLIYKFVPSYFLSRFTRLFHNPSILYPSLSAHHQLQKLRIQSSKSPLPLLLKFFNSIILRYHEIFIDDSKNHQSSL